MGRLRSKPPRPGLSLHILDYLQFEKMFFYKVIGKILSISPNTPHELFKPIIISTIYILTTKIDKPYKENKFNKPAQ